MSTPLNRDAPVGSSPAPSFSTSPTRFAGELSSALSARFRIERELGSGGMATVYLAHDLRHNRAVAIKVFHDAPAETAGAKRFLREIQIAAQLQRSVS